jgi:chemotaxis protein CheD
MKVYRSDEPPIRGGRVKVGLAELDVRSDGTTLVTSGLGSCVGIALYDPEAGVLGLAHAMLPSVENAPSDDCPERERTQSVATASPDGGRCRDSAKYVDTAVPALLEAMEGAGARRRRIRGKLAGGSTMFEFDAQEESIGTRNVAAARRTLARLGIELVAEDVGGSHGRSLELHGPDGELHVRSANQGQSVI